MTPTRLPDPPISGRVGYPIGFLAAVVLTTVAVAAQATGHPGWALVMPVAVAGAMGAATTLRAAVATGAVCWALHIGFIYGRRGELLLDGFSARAALLILATVFVAHTIATLVRLARQTVAAIPVQRRAADPPLAESLWTAT